MTREEALQKTFDVYKRAQEQAESVQTRLDKWAHFYPGVSQNSLLIDSLIALGLLKVDDEP